MKKFLLFALMLMALIVAAGEKPRYVFLFIGDGMSLPQRMAADEFNRSRTGKGLTINSMPFQAVTRTASANSLTTDSAAAATAIACGVKTNNGRIGLDASGKEKLRSVAETAQADGKKVGIVTSVTINHATPAGFYGHRKSRNEMYAIGLDLIASGFDYFGGGGLAKADDTKAPEYKGGLFKLAADAGYRIFDGKKDLSQVKAGKYKVLALAGQSPLPYEIDRPAGQPSLADFTAKGIELLDNPGGFFMMVEGGLIDYAGHNNDSGANVQEVIAFDRAVQEAVKFAAKHPGETLIVVTGDHETGGMTLGLAGAYLRTDRMAEQKCSFAVFAEKLKELRASKHNLTFEDAQKHITADFGLKFDGKGNMSLNSSEKLRLQKAFEERRLLPELKKIVNTRNGIGWSTGSHTALPVITSATGCKAELFSGFMENTEISRLLKELLKK